MQIALIADDFTRICLELEPGLNITNLTPLNWRYKMLTSKPDVLIVESAWLGFKSSWKKKIANYSSNSVNKDLQALLKYCCNSNVPTIFWNKEDPVNYHRFKQNISGFDICLSTEQEMLPHYKKEFKNLKAVALMPFFFQPKLHNPQAGNVIEDLSEKTVFCGGLYATEFPGRAVRLNNAIDALEPQNVVVYDRFKQGDSSWQEFKGLDVRPPFTYEHSKSYYQAGRNHLNVNSVDGSKTMFSRRMLELLACGAHVIDLTNYKDKGVLSPFVTQVKTKKEALAAVNCKRPEVDFNHLNEQYSVKNFTQKIEMLIG